jgi:hypothetical protein
MSFLSQFTAEDPFTRILAYGVYKQNFDATRDSTRKRWFRLTGYPEVCNEFSFKDAGTPSLEYRWGLAPNGRHCLPPYMARLFGRIETVTRVTDEVRRVYLFPVRCSDPYLG